MKARTFRPVVDVWTLTRAQRAALVPGQWVTAGPGGPLGRWAGQTSASDVVAWLGNARGRPGGLWPYWRALRAYALANAAT